MTWILVAIGIGVGVLLLAGWWLYNRLVRDRNAVDAAWSQIDVQLRRRADLIPNVVAAVRGYAAHERATLDAVVRARDRALRAPDPVERGAAEVEVARAVERLLALAEAYPDLQAQAGFLALRDDLLGTEGRIAFARQYYNERVLTYANRRDTLPAKVVSRLFRFPVRSYFAAGAAAGEAVAVTFVGEPESAR